jgi:hypothetical protein
MEELIYPRFFFEVDGRMWWNYLTFGKHWKHQNKYMWFAPTPFQNLKYAPWQHMESCSRSNGEMITWNYSYDVSFIYFVSTSV